MAQADPSHFRRLEALLAAIPGLQVRLDAPLRDLARFALGGPAALLAETSDVAALTAALHAARLHSLPWLVLGGGTNIVVADRGFPGLVLRYRGARIALDGDHITAQAGADLQHLVDFSLDLGLEGLHSLTRIPGSLGGAVYGNAGAYGHSLCEFVTRVLVLDGAAQRSLDNPACRFAYRDSAFKRHKDWVILAAWFRLPPGDPARLRREAAEIREIRDAKYPPDMRCAGSIFKNCLLADLPPAAAAQVPPSLVRAGKVPSAWFLEAVGAKGLRRGQIQVAPYHANLIFNEGGGSAADLRALIEDLKQRVADRFGFALEEEIQYVGFEDYP